MALGKWCGPMGVRCGALDCGEAIPDAQTISKNVCQLGCHRYQVPSMHIRANAGEHV